MIAWKHLIETFYCKTDLKAVQVGCVACETLIEDQIVSITSIVHTYITYILKFLYYVLD